MSFDLSRKTFNSLDDYFGVVMQQGRVQMDADWNALVAQLGRRLQAESLDTFGSAVVPRETPNGFLISGLVDAIEIGPGRIYVDGLLAENHTNTLKWDPRLAEISGTARLSGADIDAAPTALVGTSAYDDQPYYPNPPALPDGEPYLVYVDVWQRDITYLQDANLVDVAVGVDTTARRQTVWQVKFLDNVGALEPGVADLDIPGWLETIHPSSARLSIDTGDLALDEDPCLLPPQAGYKGLENQLYRVQVHNGGPLETATFKWSRDNAIVSSRLSAIAVGGLEIVVDSLGRDDVLGFKPGDWVEITDDYREFKGLPGELRRITLTNGVDHATGTIKLEGDALLIGLGDGEFHIDIPGDSTHPPRNTRIIRWDQAGTVFAEDESEYTNVDTGNGSIVIPPAGTRLFLEKGILVDFDLETVVDEATFDPEFKVGDYWIFSARVNDASVELLDRSPPMGTHHHYAKLAIINDSGINDCRTLWPPEPGGEGCACTVCVEPETHNNGTATIQQAIDLVNTQGGGTVCLSVGEYQLAAPIRITGNSVTLRGQGWQTVLMSRTPATLIEIGGDNVATDIVVENLLALTSTVRGTNTAVTVNNVIGLDLTDCLIANFAAESGTSQAVKFTGLTVKVAVNKCYFIAEQGITGPRLQDEYLATMDFSIRDCLMICSQQGISFTGISFHMNKLDLSHNHISNASDVGIELSGSALDNTAVDIEHNLLKDCINGFRFGVSNLRILHNDLEVADDSKQDGNAIIFIDGLDPGVIANQQVIANRISNYRGHGISVQTSIGKMMVKQNQINAIVGAAFIIEAGGSVEYLSLENNQFRDIDGISEGNETLHAAVSLQASVRAEITNNVFDSVVRSSQASATRTGVFVASSGDVRIAGNRLFAVSPAVYTGLGAGIIISSNVGSFEVNNNEISRIPESDDKANEKLAAALWLPLLVVGASRERDAADDSPTARTDLTNARKLTNARDLINVRANLAGLAASKTFVDSVPVVSVGNNAYAVLAKNMINLGAMTLANNNIRVSGNQLDGTSGTSVSVILTVSNYCGFMDNEVTSTNPGALVVLTADHVGANHNRLTTSDDLDILIIEARKYVLMGNMTSGNIAVNDGSDSTRPPEPWRSLNIII